MRFRFCFFDGNIRTRNFEQPGKLSKRRSQRVPQSVDSVLRPNVTEDDSGHDETKKNSNDAITDIIQICIGRITLEDAVEESERDL